MDCQNGNDRWDSESDRYSAGPHARRNEQIPSVLEDMAPGISLTISRWHDRGSDERESDLAAMSVAGESQKHTPWHFREDVRIVRDHENRRVAVRDTAEGLRNIVVVSPEITYARDPYGPRWSGDADRGVFEDSNPSPAQSHAHSLNTARMVVVSQHSHDSRGCVKATQLTGQLFGRYPGTPPSSGDKVAEEANEIGAGRVDPIDHRSQVLDTLIRRADMEIAGDGNPEWSRVRPRQRHLDFLYTETGWLQPESPQETGPD